MTTQPTDGIGSGRPATGQPPFFSVALPAYNAASTLPAAIESVLAQTFEDWELVIVDDGSTDDTGAVAAAFVARDGRIKLVSQPNAGCGAARNTAVAHARGLWIVRLDADDLLLPSYLERMRSVIEAHPDAELVSPSGVLRYPDGREAPWCPDPRYRSAFALTLGDALHGWCPLFTHAAFRRELWERIGGIRGDVYAEDFDFWARALASGATGWFFPETLSVYAFGTDTQMSERSNRIAASYLQTLEGVLAQSTLAAADRAAVSARVAALRRRVMIRTLAARLLGSRNAERLAAIVTGAVRRSRERSGR